MSLSDEFLELLRCPESRQPLIHFPDGEGGPDSPGAPFLFCPNSRLRYRIDDGVPVMLIEEAERVDDGERDRLLARAGELGLSANGDPAPAQA